MSYDVAPDPASAYPLLGALAFALLYLPLALLWARVEPWVLPRLRAAASRPVPVPAWVRRVPAFAASVRARVVAVGCALSERWFLAECDRRARAEVHSGLTVYEEWEREAWALPAAARAVMLREIRRYRPSRLKVESARRREGRARLLFRLPKSRQKGW